MPPKFRVLFLGTRNSERSILAEYILRSTGADRFEVYSAEEVPKGGVDPLVFKILRDHFKIDATGAVGHSWREFANRHFDFVITLSDDARERSPAFPGTPVTAHWSIEDPTIFEGSEEERLEHFVQVALQIKRRVDLFNCLPMEKLDHLQRQVHTRQIQEDAQKPATEAAEGGQS
jgi:arsenate reductase (thioredoxin)